MTRTTQPSRLRHRRLLAAVLCLVVVSPLLAPGALAGPTQKKPPEWRATGSALLPSLAYATSLEWEFTCPGIPATQGVSDYVVEIPREFGLGTGIAELHISPATPTPLIGGSAYMSFWDGDCRRLDSVGEALAPVPRGSAFVLLGDDFQGRVQFELTLTVDPAHPMHGAAPPAPSQPPEEPRGDPDDSRRKPPQKARQWKTEGAIHGPALLFVTFLEWSVSCPSMPVTQGVSDYVVEIPPAFRKGDAIAEVVTRARGPVTSQANLSFEDAGCRGIARAEAPSSVPAGTRFIDVWFCCSVANEFELTLTIDRGHPLHDSPPE